MNTTRVIDMSLSLLVLLAGSLFVPTSSLGAQEAELTVGVEAADQATGAPSPTISRAIYEVHVWGGMAAGRLTQELINEQESESRVIYRTTNRFGAAVQRIEMEAGGVVAKLQIERPEPEPRKQSARTPRSTQPTPPGSRNAGGGRAAALSQPVTVQTEPFDLAAEETTSVHTDLRWSIPLEGRMFHLQVPAIRAIGGPVESEAIPVQLSVVVHHNRPLLAVRSDSHQILVEFLGDTTIIEPVEREIAGDRPFEVRFAVSDRESPTVAGYLLDDGAGRVGVEAVINPPEAPSDEAVRPKQLLFLIDSSGSMKRQEKMEQARRSVLSCIDKLNPADRFNIVEFDHRYRLMLPEPVDPGSFDYERVARWLEGVKADGETRILAALEAALEQPEDPERHRMLVVVTDGFISDEEEALALLRRKLGEARLFVVGTGQSKNQATLLRLAEYGRGAAVFAGDARALEEAVEELYASISSPLGWDVQLDLGSADVEEILPSRLPDLYAGRPVRVIAWVNGDLPSQMSLRMSTVDGDRLYNVVLPPRID